MENLTEKRVLLVEDNEVIRSVLLHLLKGEGYKVYSADNGRDALASLRINRPHLVILDIWLPVMDGWEVLRQMRQDKEFADVQIVVITAYDNIQAKAKALAEGCLAYLSKPFEIENLLAHVSEAWA